MARKSQVVLEDQHGVVVCRLADDIAAGKVARGQAFWLGTGRLRLADRSHSGAGIDRGTPPGISARQAHLGAEAEYAEKFRRAAASPAARYQAARTRAWGEISDRLAVRAV